ncbi:hypothetical protein D477_009515 [Arthrobacter crystallopoietes BAB-32]|uniref:Uncharacterized protein n=1 Tax=Arthrobacter crystallopoietes BAB-32 TaxID=1246476 RepID=N1UZG1_9MICC|nr:hypothetical protein D477_009515 [Arthrobacter crystallopoietes BAB-32]
MFERLAKNGYLEEVSVGSDGETWWITTISGNAVAMASFAKPITRRTADRLVAGLLERTEKYNADPGKLLYVERLRIFGSYIDRDIDPLGDVDVEIRIGRRSTDPKDLLAYTAASDRRFNTYLDRLFWPERELIMILKNRSAAINITDEDVERITERFETLYEMATDPKAIPADLEGIQSRES